MIKGIINKMAIKDSKEPITVNLTASYPFPCNNNLWPGKTLKAISESGAPRNIEGIESKKVCVTAIDIIKTDKVNGSVVFKRNVDKLKIMILIRFTWIPGIKPVMIPAKIPIKIAIKQARNILLFSSFSFRRLNENLFDFVFDMPYFFLFYFFVFF